MNEFDDFLGHSTMEPEIVKSLLYTSSIYF